MSMPSLQGHKFINRERPRSQKPDNGLAYFASSGQAPQPVQRELLPDLVQHIQDWIVARFSEAPKHLCDFPRERPRAPDPRVRAP